MKNSRQNLLLSITPRRLFVTVLAIVFFSELVIMATMVMLTDWDPYVETFIDAASLSIVVAFFLWGFVVRPLSRAAMEEKKHAEVLVASAEKRYKDLFDSSKDGIYWTDAEGTFVLINQSGAEILGYGSPIDVIGTKVTDFWRDPAGREAFIAELKSKKSVMAYPIPAKRNDGSQIYLEATSRILEDAGGGYLGVEGILRDVTEKKMIQEAIERKNRELEKAYNDLKAAQSQILQQEKMASIGQLAAGIAHEINNPVGFIMSNLNSLQKFASRLKEFINIQSGALKDAAACPDDPASILNTVMERSRQLKVDYVMEDVNNLINESLEGAGRMKQIVQDLRSFSHAGEAESKMADINSGLQSTINIVWNELKYKATLKKEYGEVPAVRCNLGQLNQVFMNLLVNAAHAIEKQGEITVKTWCNDGLVCISISDTGSGIPKENLNRIFEPFFTTKEVGKGTGLGLSIAYDIVKKHKGEIMVDSEVGKGTTFTIKIPATEQKTPASDKLA